MPFAYDYRPLWLAPGDPPRAGGWHLVVATQRWHLYQDLLSTRGTVLVRACDSVRVERRKRPALLHLAEFTPQHGETVCESCRAEWDRLAALPVYVPTTLHR